MTRTIWACDSCGAEAPEPDTMDELCPRCEYGRIEKVDPALVLAADVLEATTDASQTDPAGG